MSDLATLSEIEAHICSLQDNLDRATSRLAAVEYELGVTRATLAQADAMAQAVENGNAATMQFWARLYRAGRGIEVAGHA